jgi:hypothetical protein
MKALTTPKIIVKMTIVTMVSIRVNPFIYQASEGSEGEEKDEVLFDF